MIVLGEQPKVDLQMVSTCAQYLPGASCFILLQQDKAKITRRMGLLSEVFKIF